MIVQDFAVGYAPPLVWEDVEAVVAVHVKEVVPEGARAVAADALVVVPEVAILVVLAVVKEDAQEAVQVLVLRVLMVVLTTVLVVAVYCVKEDAQDVAVGVLERVKQLVRVLAKDAPEVAQVIAAANVSEDAEEAVLAAVVDLAPRAFIVVLLEQVINN